ncbi:hypothetical protein CDV31_017285, partial [Fusarium ambrosium]
MAEPGTPAPDIPAIYARLRRFEETFDSRSKGIEQSLADLRATLQAGEPISSASLLNKTSEDFASFVNDTRKDFTALANETHEKVNALAERVHPLPQASQEPQARAEKNGSLITHGALGQEQGDPGREVQQSSADDATYGLTRTSAGHLVRKDAHGDNSVSSMEASRDTPMRDYYQVQPSLPGSTATTVATASASQSAPGQATVADSRSDLRAPSDHQHGTPAIHLTPDSQSDGSIGQNPTTSGEQEREPGGHDPDTLMTDAEQPTCGRQDLAKRAAGATVVTSPRAHEGEGGPRPIAANDQPAESPGPEEGPEDGTDRLVGMSTPDRHKTTPLLIPNPASRGPSPNDSTAAEEQPLGETVSSRGDTASSPVSTPSPSGGTTAQGSDTTEDTSRASTPDTHLTSPDTSAPGSTPKLTLSEADMGERL